jgi:Tol biopolymer transport system component
LKRTLRPNGLHLAVGLMMAAVIGLPGLAVSDDDLDFLTDAPAPGDPTHKTDSRFKKIAAGLHDGHAFGPRIRADGKWVAYGVREEKKGTFKTAYYARPLEGDGLFRTIWPNQHPSFADGEGTASFTDLVGFEWAGEGDHNAMVVQHKTKGEEVLLETMAVRFTGKGAQYQPAISGDGGQVVVVSEADDGSQTDLWVAPTGNPAEPLQLTFTRESERVPMWHPKDEQIIYELRNPLGGDIWVFDLATFQTAPLVRWGTSDEVLPSFSPKGDSFAFLSNKDDPDGVRWDLFVNRPGDALPKAVVRGVRRSEKSTGYTWGPLGKYLVTVLDDEKAKYPLVIVPTDGSAEPKPLSTTQDNMDPQMVEIEGSLRLVWVALDMDRPEDRRYRIVFVSDFDIASFGQPDAG